MINQVSMHHLLHQLSLHHSSHMHESHEKINGKVAQNNDNQEMRAHDRNKLKIFNIGDVKQLHARNADPFQILKKLNNVYAINIFINVSISSTFNVEYLVN